MKNLLTIGTLLVLLITLGTPSELIARKKKGERNNFRKNRTQKGMMMDLTEDQKKKIKEIRLSGVEQSKMFKDELRELSAKHKTLVTADSPNTKAIEKSLERMSVLKLELQKIKTEKNQEVRSILTKEQLLKFDQKQSHRAHNSGKRTRNQGKKRRN
jgi:Spy/CpxP family protein refolding chaperone